MEELLVTVGSVARDYAAVSNQSTNFTEAVLDEVEAPRFKCSFRMIPEAEEERMIFRSHHIRFSLRENTTLRRYILSELVKCILFSSDPVIPPLQLSIKCNYSLVMSWKMSRRT